jgi:plasmid replication initiation protein
MQDSSKGRKYSRLNITQLKETTDSLLTKIVHIAEQNARGEYTGGWRAFQLFKECVISHDDSGDWYVEIDAHDKSLPLMFEFKAKYFAYELWNVLRLRSENQLIMYEQLKQYEKAGERIITVARLRERLGIKDNEYPLYHDFKRYVLDVCQTAFKENTDITFEYEPYGKRGIGGKILSLKFTINKNTSYNGQITLNEWLIEQPEDDIIDEEEEPLKTRLDERLDLLSTACDGLYATHDDLVVLNDLTMKMGLHDDIQATNYVASKYHEMLSFIGKGEHIKNRPAYLKGMIKNDFA